jgi:glucokinase
MRVLAGDIGGTKTNLGLFDTARRADDGRDAPALLASASYPSGEHRGLEAILADFLTRTREHHEGEIAAAAFGIAGPVEGSKVETLNLPWLVDGSELADRFDLPTVTLLNDLQATGAGIPALLPDELAVLQEGRPPPPDAAAALLAAGTGMGMALLIPVQGRWQVQATEGGHVDLAPRRPEQIELLEFLFELHPDHVSVESAVCGPGLLSLYRFMVARGRPRHDAELNEAIERDPNEAPPRIAAAALGHRCRACDAALDLFCDLYGAAAGNLALTCLARGGVYLGGGIAPKILDRLRDGTFLDAFAAKGRFNGLLKTLPVRVILNQQTALFGAAREAEQQANNLAIT